MSLFLSVEMNIKLIAPDRYLHSIQHNTNPERLTQENTNTVLYPVTVTAQSNRDLFKNLKRKTNCSNIHTAHLHLQINPVFIKKKKKTGDSTEIKNKTIIIIKLLM